MFLRSSRLGRSRLSRAFGRRREPTPARILVDPVTSGVVLEYGAELPATGNTFLTAGTNSVTLFLEPPTFVGDVSSPYPSIIVEVT